jgi:hypothetical protein
MSNRSSILGGERVARRASGKDVDTLGPSDSSDSGSDVQGERAMPTGADLPDELGALPVRGDNDSDSAGTGERASATGADAPDGADIAPDRIRRAGPGADDPDAPERSAESVEDLVGEDGDYAEVEEADDEGDAGPVEQPAPRRRR